MVVAPNSGDSNDITWGNELKTWRRPFANLRLALLPRSPPCPPPLHRWDLPRLELRRAPGPHPGPQQRGVFHGGTRPRWRIPPGPGHGGAPRHVSGSDRDAARQRRLRHRLRVRGQDGAGGERQGHGPSVPVPSHARWHTADGDMTSLDGEGYPAWLFHRLEKSMNFTMATLTVI